MGLEEDFPEAKLFPAGYYTAIARRLSRLPKTGSIPLDVHEIGRIQHGFYDAPFYKIETQGRFPVLLTGSIHGSEHAGAPALIEFFEHHAHSYKDLFAFHCFPCVNPSGYDACTRNTLEGVNLNQHFKDDSPIQEIHTLVDHLPQHVVLSLDLHETNVHDEGVKGYSQRWPLGFYLFESEVGYRMGKEIIAEVGHAGMGITKLDALEGEKIEDGVITWKIESDPVKSWGGSLDTYLIGSKRADHTLVFETPTHLLMNIRIQGHVTALCTALDLYRERLGA